MGIKIHFRLILRKNNFIFSVHKGLWEVTTPKGVSMFIFKHFQLIWLFLCCFNAMGAEEAQISSALSPALHGESLNGNSSAVESPAPIYIESAQLNVEIGSKFLFSGSGKTILQAPILLELQVPVITESGNIRWLVQAKGGVLKFFCSLPERPEKPEKPHRLRFKKPEKPKPPFDDEFFQRNYRKRLSDYEQDLADYQQQRTDYEQQRTDYEQQRTDYEQKSANCFSPLYVGLKTGLQYNFDPVFLSLLAGPILSFSGPRSLGLTGDLLLGFNTSGILYFKAGMNFLYYDRMYWGGSVAMGLTMKKWWKKFSL